MNWIGEEQLNGLRFDFQVKKSLCNEKTPFQKIELFHSISHGRVLLLDGKVMLTEADEFVYHEMLSHIPIFEHHAPKKVLIIGGGDGGTLRECLRHPRLHVTLCEIDERVIEVSKKYLSCIFKDWKNPRAKIVVGDGFDFLRNTKDFYDIILVDSTDPIGEAAKLFGANFFKLAKSRLKSKGLICFQCESPFYHRKIIKKTLKTISSHFANYRIYTASIPTYPSGLWCFVLASDSKINAAAKKSTHKARFSKKLKYYNFKIHQSAFVLPNFVQNLLSK